jgi:DNA-binding CsgD family transcriptional regulator
LKPMSAATRKTVNAFLDLFPKLEAREGAVNYKAEKDREIILQKLQFAETVFPDRALTTCPISHPNMSYFSMNCEHILGHAHEILASMSVSDFLQLAHPEDIPYVQQCFAFVKRLERVDPTTHRFSIYYRMRNAAGTYFYIRNENLAIQTENNTCLYLMLFSNISREEKFYHVKLEVSRKTKGKFIPIYSYNPKQEERPITPRQNDIAQLIAKGYTNQEIAEQLNVSIYTVKNHKQLLFRKVNVKNSVELAHYVRSQRRSTL